MPWSTRPISLVMSIGTCSAIILRSHNMEPGLLPNRHGCAYVGAWPARLDPPRAGLARISTRPSRQEGVRSLGMSQLSRLLLQSEKQMVVHLSRFGRQAAGFFGIALTILPDIFNLAILVILLYAAIISCAPVFNELLWTPDEGVPPPIRGTKWEDYDRGMQIDGLQKILRTYKMGDVDPTGTHIKEWNRQLRRRQTRLNNAVQAAKKYKRALEAERRGSMRVQSTSESTEKKGRIARFFSKISLAPSSKALLYAAQRAKEEYMRAKADYMQEGKWSASFIRPKRYGGEDAQSRTELEKADDKNQEAELEAMLMKLKEMKDQPVAGEVVDTTSQFGARGLADLVSSEKTFTLLWPKAVAPDGLHRAPTEDSSKSSDSDFARGKVSKEARLRGEKLPQLVSSTSGQKDIVKTYNVFGSQRTVLETAADTMKRKRFGVPVLVVVIPVVLGTSVLYYHVFTTIMSFITALLAAILLQTMGPLQRYGSITLAKYGAWYMSIINTLAGTAAICEAVVLTIIDIISWIIASGLATLASLVQASLAHIVESLKRMIPASWIATASLVSPMPADMSILQEPPITPPAAVQVAFNHPKAATKGHLRFMQSKLVGTGGERIQLFF